MLRHIIFDMDGTLCDTGKITVGACREAAVQFSLPQLPEEHIIRTIGIATPEFYERLYPQEDAAQVAAFGEMVEAMEAERVPLAGPEILFPGVKEMLLDLREKGFRLYLASTGHAEHVDGVLQTSGIQSLFDSINCGRPAKVGMVNEIIGQGDRSEWAMLGDTHKDLEAARGNGILALGAAFGYCHSSAWADYDQVFHAPQDLVAFCQASAEGSAL